MKDTPNYNDEGCVICNGHGEPMDTIYGEIGCDWCVAKCISCGSQLLIEDMEECGMRIDRDCYICETCIEREQEHDQDEALFNIVHAMIAYNKTICIL